MNKTLNRYPFIKEYYKILEENYPSYLDEYIDTNQMKRLNFISTSCGTIYSNLFKNKTFYSSKEHSIGVALIIYHFTKDKRQTLSGLFHDIATPTFKHTIDFLNGDYLKQESTEELTSFLIEHDDKINKLLSKDNIKLNEVDNYHIYPVADNDTPKLSSDRLEYSLSNALIIYNLLSLEEVKEIYNDIEIELNEENTQELGFKDLILARKFVEVTSKMSVLYRDDKTRYSMQLLADIIKQLNKDNIISKKDLYNLKEEEIINIINTSNYHDIFNIWINSSKVIVEKIPPKDTYYVHQPAKIRYIDPLVNGKRISTIDQQSKKYIQDNLNYNMDNYIYIPKIKTLRR